ncbi:MAG: signal peptidase I [Anaerolineae bacterium]|nr:signal peptidase I [Anaerolineae bacterium]
MASFARDMLETLLLALVLFVAVRTALQNTRVDGHSMEPTLRDGQYLMVNKLAYRLGAPGRGDIVVFPSPQEGGKALIKRVIGLPGEEIAVVSGQVYINGARLAEPYLAVNHGVSNFGPLVLQNGEYLVMGDNRTNSNDSRNFGPVHESALIGKAWFSLWPPFESLEHGERSTLAQGEVVSHD